MLLAILAALGAGFLVVGIYLPRTGTNIIEERLAAFLLNLSQRFTARGFSPSEFHLRMKREEIGSYLGLSLETVSRLFSRFHEEGLISVQQKHVRILNIPGLKAMMFK